MGHIKFNGATLDPKSLEALVGSTLVQGNSTSKWWSRQSSDFLDGFMDTIRTSMNNGESLQQAITRIAGGTVDGVFVPGIMKTTRAKAGALAATSINAVSNRAALESYQLNADVIKWVTQMSTLDNKTSDICVAYSGQTWSIKTLMPVAGSTLPFNGGPPRHFNCRSRLRPVTKSFKELGIPLEEFPTSTRASIDGQIPADITFDEFLRGKSMAFQDELLGPARAKLWREKKITLTQLVDMRGNPMTLSQLEARHGIKAARPRPNRKVESFIEDVKITEREREELESLADDVVEKATKADPTVTKQIVDIADDVEAIFPKAAAPGAVEGAEEVVEGSLTYYRLKGATSTARKIQTYAAKFGITNAQAAERLSDALRYTFLIDDANYVAGIKQTMEKFRELGYVNGKFDVAWFTRPDYRGVNINMITPQGVKMELQFHTPRSFHIKQNVNHPLYETYRTLPKARQAGKEGAALQRLMQENAESIPLPEFLDLLEDLADLYNNFG